MEELVVRPSTKLLTTAYGVAMFTIICLAIAKGMNLLSGLGAYWPLGFAPPIVYLLWTAAQHMYLRLTKLVINDDRVRLETGLLSKQMHAIDVSKVHDVRVEQSVKQRVLGVGNLSIETANASSRIQITDIDRPQEIADRILQLSRKAFQQRGSVAGPAA